MAEALYRNYEHYISDGWSSQPKEKFKKVHEIIEAETLERGPAIIDIGCATGELLGYLRNCFPDSRMAGIDVSDDLLDEARRLTPSGEFINSSVLSLPSQLAQSFDIACAIGCMSIFDETEIESFWDGLLSVVRTDGFIIALSPLNEFGVDIVVRHRKRMGGLIGDWERGWNVYAFETVGEILRSRGWEVKFERFALPMDLPPQDDPVRTWTMQTEKNGRQLTNGLKFLIDYYFIIARRERSK